MTLENVMTLLCGLGLFLYGMKLMGEGLELAAGSKLKNLVERLTTNKYMGALIGLLVTAVIQSSSATTVMVVGFVNAGIMQLGQAVGVIMGANIGTTVTGFMIAIKLNQIAPLAIFTGVDNDVL
ncbi:MAG: Na/Pi symporter [Hydrogeniiclostridium mannosilyticum]